MEIRKIPLEGLIDILVEIYNSGIDFIDMRVEKRDKQDHIWFFENTSEAPPIKTEKEENIDFESLI